MQTADINMTDSPSLKGREDRYATILVDSSLVIESWRQSLFSFEWLNPDGSLRTMDELPLHERDKRLKVEKALAAGKPVERPVLGIGILDNVEIGAGRDVFLTLCAQGMKRIEVHVPVSAQGELRPYIAQ